MPAFDPSSTAIAWIRPFAVCTVSSSASGSEPASAASEKTSTTVCEATSPASAPPMPSATTNSGGSSRNESSLPSRSRPTSDIAACSTTPSSAASGRITSLVGDDPTASTYSPARGAATCVANPGTGMYARPKGRPGRPPPKPTLTIARCTTLPVAALAVLVAVPLALAAALPGGGKYAGKTDDAQSVTLRLTSDAKRVKKMRIHYTVTCNDGRSGDTYTDILNPRIRSDHTFRGSGTYKGSGDGSENVFKVTGKVSAKK